MQPTNNFYATPLQLSATILMDGGDQYGVGSVHLDTFEELAWAANIGVSPQENIA